MISCWLDGGRQFGVCATAARASAKKSFHIRVLKVEPHRSGDQPWLAEMPEIAAGTLPRDAAGTQGRPIVYIAGVIRRDPPSGRFSHDFGGVADAEIEDVVLRCVGAVNVVDRPAAYMLPIEIKVGAED